MWHLEGFKRRHGLPHWHAFWLWFVWYLDTLYTLWTFWPEINQCISYQGRGWIWWYRTRGTHAFRSQAWQRTRTRLTSVAFTMGTKSNDDGHSSLVRLLDPCPKLWKRFVHKFNYTNTFKCSWGSNARSDIITRRAAAHIEIFSSFSRRALSLC